jgi:hypothetical protein
MHARVLDVLADGVVHDRACGRDGGVRALSSTLQVISGPILGRFGPRRRRAPRLSLTATPTASRHHAVAATASTRPWQVQVRFLR